MKLFRLRYKVETGHFSGRKETEQINLQGYSWAEFHGALTHFPVAFIIGAFLFEAGAMLFKKPEWRTVSFWLLVGAVVASVPTLLSGIQTAKSVYGHATGLPDIASDHRAFAFMTMAIAAVLLVWRIVAKDRLVGPALWGAAAVLLIASGTVSYTGYLGGKMVFGGSTSSNASRDDAASSSTPVLHKTAAAVDPALVIAGQSAYQTNGCSSCHMMNGSGGNVGPDLTHEALKNSDPAWQEAHLRNPSKMSPGSTMPSFNSLTPAQLKALAAFLATRK